MRWYAMVVAGGLVAGCGEEDGEPDLAPLVPPERVQVLISCGLAAASSPCRWELKPIDQCGTPAEGCDLPTRTAMIRRWIEGEGVLEDPIRYARGRYDFRAIREDPPGWPQVYEELDLELDPDGDGVHVIDVPGFPEDLVSAPCWGTPLGG